MGEVVETLGIEPSLRSGMPKCVNENGGLQNLFSSTSHYSVTYSILLFDIVARAPSIPSISALE